VSKNLENGIILGTDTEDGKKFWRRVVTYNRSGRKRRLDINGNLRRRHAKTKFTQGPVSEGRNSAGQFIVDKTKGIQLCLRHETIAEEFDNALERVAFFV
jgi:hypothetical protein